MQSCDFRGYCQFDGLIRPGQARLIARGRVAHLDCAQAAIRKLEQWTHEQHLPPEQQRYVQQAIAHLERAATSLDLSDTGSLQLDLADLAAPERPASPPTQPTRCPPDYLN